jgi:hypothetical protein
MTGVSNLPDISGTLRMHTRCLCHTASSYSLREQGYNCVNVQLLLGQHVQQPDEQAIQQATHCQVQSIIQHTTSIHTLLLHILNPSATQLHFRLIMKLL